MNVGTLIEAIARPTPVPPVDPADRDRDLLERVRRGDPDGAAALFETWAAPILRFTDRMLGNRAEAEEVSQEVFLKMITRADQYDGRAPVSSWLFTIAANACRDRLRKSGRHLPLEAAGEPVSPAAGVLERLIDRQQKGAVRAALAKLSDEQREALVLARYDGLRYGEIARILGISEGAVKTRIFRAMEILKSHFSEGVTQ